MRCTGEADISATPLPIMSGKITVSVNVNDTNHAIALKVTEALKDNHKPYSGASTVLWYKAKGDRDAFIQCVQEIVELQWMKSQDGV